jgi:hypothetical protein
LPKITADGIKITKEDKKKSEDDNKAKYINLSNNIIKMISDIKKLESYLNKDEGKVLKEAIDNFSFDQHFITDEVTDIHAEMRIVNYIFAQENKTKNEASNDKYYVGISKLSCVHCNMILGALGKNNPQQWHQAMRGYHGRGFDWKLPDFYLNKFEDIFSHNKKLVNLFKKAKEQDEQFLKEIIINAESLFNANCRLNSKNNELNADYSSSVPTLVTQAGFDSDITSPTSPAASDAPWQNSLQSNKNNGILFAMT